jgi:hypothetical protein
VLNCLSLKAYTVGMVDHDRLPGGMDRRPIKGYRPMQILDLDRAPEFWLAAHMGEPREGIKRGNDCNTYLPKQLLMKL